MFNAVKKTTIVRGNFFMFFTSRDRFFRYLRGVLIGLPVWYVIGILMTFSDNFAREFGIGEIDPAKAVLYQYVGLVFGDLSAGIISNLLKSRKKTLFLFYGLISMRNNKHTSSKLTQKILKHPQCWQVKIISGFIQNKKVRIAK